MLGPGAPPQLTHPPFFNSPHPPTHPPPPPASQVVWVGQPNHPRNNSWVAREALVETGYAKMCNDLDARLAGLMKYRPLSTPAVMAHLNDFGLPEDTAAHTAIKGLSGGQKVRRAPARAAALPGGVACVSVWVWAGMSILALVGHVWRRRVSVFAGVGHM